MKNKRLNIKIKNSKLFEIKEKEDNIELYYNDILMLKVYKNSIVNIFDKSTVKVYENSTVSAFDESTLETYGDSIVSAFDGSTVRAYNDSRVTASGESKVEAYDSSIVTAIDNSKVEAYDSSIVTASGESKVEAYDFSCIYKKSNKIKINQINHFGAMIEQVFKVKKKTVVYKKLEDDKIAKLELEKGQSFQSEDHNKCRTNKAKVLSITNMDNTETYKYGCSQHDNNFIYEVGKTVEAEYDEEIRECSKGIHFYLNRREAEKH